MLTTVATNLRKLKICTDVIADESKRHFKIAFDTQMKNYIGRKAAFDIFVDNTFNDILFLVLI